MESKLKLPSQGNTQDYSHPANSILPAVLHTGQGLPITLCIIHAAVGRRVGLNIQGESSSWLPCCLNKSCYVCLMTPFWPEKAFTFSTIPVHHLKTACSSGCTPCTKMEPGFQEKQSLSAASSCEDICPVLTGANVPSHFLNKFEDGGKTVYIDCFNGGRIMSR